MITESTNPNQSNMKSLFLVVSLSISSMASFILAYFYNLTMSNFEQCIALLAVIFVDGFFGCVAGTKREGFQTRKALKVLKTAAIWLIILVLLLAIEKGFPGLGWLSETILVPFLLFQLVSALKNASMAGFIQADMLNSLLDKIDQHKGDRTPTKPKRTKKKHEKGDQLD